MKKYGILLLTAFVLALSYGVSGVRAEDNAAPVSVEAEITGMNYCILQALAKSEIAAATPAYANLNALKVTEAIVDGKGAPELTGKTLHYLPSKAAEKVMIDVDAQNKKVTVKGLLFKNESALLVKQVEVEGGDADEWQPITTGRGTGTQVL